jgi:hypothetical protein
VDYRHLNNHTKKDKTPLPIMTKLQGRLGKATHFTRIDSINGFNLIQMALGHEKFTAFRAKIGQYEYMLIPFGLTNPPATLQRQIN